MCFVRSASVLTFLGVVLSVASTVLAEEEITIGRSAAGELQIDIDFAQPLELRASIFSAIGIYGYATGDMGVHSAAEDDPTNDFFQLSTAADFRLILLAKDPGMEVLNDTGSAFMQTNEMFYIGPPFFDTHPIWNIAVGTPGNTYSLTLKIRDVNGVYPDSAPFVLSFTPEILHRLNIASLDLSRANLLWSTNAVDWELQTSVSLTGTNWITITNSPDIAGINFSLTIDTVETQRFFRLRKP